jgi:hypothetical protein
MSVSVFTSYKINNLKQKVNDQESAAKYPNKIDILFVMDIRSAAMAKPFLPAKSSSTPVLSRVQASDPACPVK